MKPPGVGMKPMKQKRKEVKPESESGSEQLTKLLEKEVKVPPIEDALTAAKQALQAAQKQKRTHRCRICDEHDCKHVQRIYDDNEEGGDMNHNPKTGELYIDKGG